LTALRRAAQRCTQAARITILAAAGAGNPNGR